MHLFCLVSLIQSLLCFSAFSFLTENELPLNPYISLSNFSFSVKNCFKEMRTSAQLNSESVVLKDCRETVRSYLSGPPAQVSLSNISLILKLWRHFALLSSYEKPQISKGKGFKVLFD